MTMRFSRAASAFSVAAALAMTALPVAAQARGWNGGWGGGWGRRHHDNVDAGDIFAGILILGGIAAIASAASKSDRDRRARTEDDGEYRDAQRRDAPAYGARDSSSQRDERPTWQEGRGIDTAVNTCVSEVERSSNKVDSVDSVNRDGEGWRVEGKIASGRSFGCSIGNDGRIHSVTVDGRAAYATGATNFVSEPVVQGAAG